MDELKISWTQTAIKQRNSIFRYWNKRNRSMTYSKKLNNAIKARVNLLKSQPNIGKETELSGVKMISMRHYAIFYALKEESIFIISFWDNRQNPEKLLTHLKEE